MCDLNLCDGIFFEPGCALTSDCESRRATVTATGAQIKFAALVPATLLTAAKQAQSSITSTSLQNKITQAAAALGTTAALPTMTITGVAAVSHSGSSSHTTIIIGSVLGGVGCLFFTGLYVWLWTKPSPTVDTQSTTSPVQVLESSGSVFEQYYAEPIAELDRKTGGSLCGPLHSDLEAKRADQRTCC